MSRDRKDDPAVDGALDAAEVTSDPGLDTDIRASLAELGGAIDDSYFSSFASKVAARLEVEVMENTDVTRDENSGLHEIKALASSTKKRLQRRRTTENDIQEQLLASSSNALQAVVLPDPSKSKEFKAVVPIDKARRVRARGTEAPGVTDLEPVERSAHHEPPKSRAGMWLAGVAAVAAAAAVAVFMLKGSGGDDGAGDQVAVNDTPAASPAAADEQRPAAAAAQTDSPSVQTLAAKEATAADSEDKTEVKADDPKADPMPAKGQLGSAAGAEKDKQSERALAKAERRARERADKKAKTAADRKSADDDSAGERESAAKKPATAPVAPSATGGAAGAKSIDDILDGVSGPPEDAPAKAKPAERQVDKDRLDGGDLRRAMRRVGTKGCQEKTGFVGRVTVKFTVSPSGRVSSAKASGPAGSCMAAAVKRAKFPSFNPPSMSFSYPFTLDE